MRRSTNPGRWSTSPRRLSLCCQAVIPHQSLDLAVTGHRVRRTFGFVDLSGFTEYGNTYGDDQAVAQLSTFRAIVRAVGSSTGVRVAKWLGDGAMLVSLEPISMMSAVLDISRRIESLKLDLPLHGGVAEGQVILFEGDDHIGVTVNLAARLADAAQPGQILAPVELLPGIERSNAVIDPVKVQGFDEPIAVADITRAVALVESNNL